jgi:hypothetical protein
VCLITTTSLQTPTLRIIPRACSTLYRTSLLILHAKPSHNENVSITAYVPKHHFMTMQEACRYSVAHSRRWRYVGKVSFYVSSPCKCSTPLQVSQPTARHRLYIHVLLRVFSTELQWCEAGITDSLCGYGSARLLGTSAWLPCPPQGANWQKVTVLSQSKYMSVPSQCIGAILKASI